MLYIYLKISIMSGSTNSKDKKIFTTMRVKKKTRDKAKAKAAIQGKTLETYIEELIKKDTENNTSS